MLYKIFVASGKLCLNYSRVNAVSIEHKEMSLKKAQAKNKHSSAVQCFCNVATRNTLKIALEIFFLKFSYSENFKICYVEYKFLL